jgi:prophage DNA circulation protein
MFKPEIEDAAPIVIVTMDALLQWLPKQGHPGSSARRACGDVKARCLQYLRSDALGPPLAEAFQLSREAGLTLQQMDNVRSVAAAQVATLVGSIVVRDACIELALVEMSRIIAAVAFVSKLDVESVRDKIVNPAFAEVEEEVADQMDSIMYRALIGLHAAIIAFLTETARPLPRMLYFNFAQPQPTLMIAYKLYADAGRADELRKENKVVHPAFELPIGRALSQ